MPRRWITSALFLALACKPSDSTGPGGGRTPPPSVNLQNPSFFIGGVAAFEAAWSSPAVRSATGLGAAVGVAGTAPTQAPTCAAGARETPASALDVFPDTALGRIYLYDSASGHFRAGPDSGAPANGVEFVLPVVDTSGHVVFPAQGAGTLDLFDVTPTGGVLTLHGVINGLSSETADYTFAVAGRPDSNSGILSGRVARAGRVFTFRDSTTGYLGQTTAGAVVTDSGHGGTMKLIATKTQTDAFDYFYDLDFTYQSPGQRVRLLGSMPVYCLIQSVGLTVTVNDSDFAIVNQGTNGPVITSLTDSTLSPAQDSAIRALMRGQDELFRRLAGLALPAKQFLP